MGYKLSFAFRATLWLIAFFVVVWAMLVFGKHLSYFRSFYFILGNWKAAILLTGLAFALGGILKYLLMLMWRIETGVIKKPRHKRLKKR